MATAPTSTKSRIYKLRPMQIIMSKDKKESLLYVEKRGMYGGYRIHFLKEELPPYLKNFVICSNCEGILRDACGVGDPQAFVCLTCAQGRDSIVLRPNREAVASLTVSCPLKSRGCGWEGKISECEPHLDVCGLFRLECQLSCGKIIRRSDMSTHLNKNCPLRQVRCEYCALIHKEKETNIHQEKCLEFSLKCPNECGDVLQRKTFKQYTEQVCENTVIECPYKEYGCEVKVARKEMEQHKSENRLIHLEIKTDSLCELLKQEISVNRSLLLSEGKTTFRINNVTKLGGKPQHVGNLLISDMQNDQLIQISCHLNDVTLVEPTGSDGSIIIGIFNRKNRTKLLLKGFIVVINQSDNSINSKHEYSIALQRAPFEPLLLFFMTTEELVEIPYKQVLQPGVCVNDSILVQLYYSRVTQ